MHIRHKISRSKGNQTKKFSQLIGYNMRNIFLEKWHTKCDDEIVLEPFLKNQN